MVIKLRRVSFGSVCLMKEREQIVRMMVNW